MYTNPTSNTATTNRVKWTQRAGFQGQGLDSPRGGSTAREATLMIRLVAPLTVVGGGDRALSRSKHTLSMAARARPPLRTSEGGLPGRPAHV